MNSNRSNTLSPSGKNNKVDNSTNPPSMSSALRKSQNNGNSTLR